MFEKKCRRQQFPSDLQKFHWEWFRTQRDWEFLFAHITTTLDLSQSPLLHRKTSEEILDRQQKWMNKRSTLTGDHKVCHRNWEWNYLCHRRWNCHFCLQILVCTLIDFILDWAETFLCRSTCWRANCVSSFRNNYCKYFWTEYFSD